MKVAGKLTSAAHMFTVIARDERPQSELFQYAKVVSVKYVQPRPFCMWMSFS